MTEEGSMNLRRPLRLAMRFCVANCSKSRMSASMVSV